MLLHTLDECYLIPTPRRKSTSSSGLLLLPGDFCPSGCVSVYKVFLQHLSTNSNFFHPPASPKNNVPGNCHAAKQYVKHLQVSVVFPHD
jgi:hypothetical protein